MPFIFLFLGIGLLILSTMLLNAHQVAKMLGFSEDAQELLRLSLFTALFGFAIFMVVYPQFSKEGIVVAVNVAGLY